MAKPYPERPSGFSSAEARWLRRGPAESAAPYHSSRRDAFRAHDQGATCLKQGSPATHIPALGAASDGSLSRRHGPHFWRTRTGSDSPWLSARLPSADSRSPNCAARPRRFLRLYRFRKHASRPGAEWRIRPVTPIDAWGAIRSGHLSGSKPANFESTNKVPSSDSMRVVGQCCLKNCTSRSCRSAACRVLNVPRFRHLPV
jgi:hypothetical protein